MIKIFGSRVDGSLRFDTRVDSGGFNTGIKNLGSSLGRLRNSLFKVASAVGVAFSITAVVSFGKTCIDTATEVENAWVGLNSIINGQGKSFDNAKKFIKEYVSDGLVPLNNAVTAYKNLSLRGYNEEQIQAVMNSLKNSATYARQSQYTLGDAVSTATEGLKNENSILVDNAGVTKNVAQMWKEYAKSIGVSYTSLTKEQKIQAEVNGILEETKFQMGDASKYTNTYSGQIARLSAVFTNLKTKIGNILKVIVSNFLPSINNAISAVERLADKVTALFNSWGIQTDVVDSLTGITDVTTDSTDSLTDSIDETSEATEKLKNQLAGFDKLNVLKQEDEESSSSDVTTTSELSSNTNVGVDSSSVENTAEKLKKMLSQIDFGNLGKTLAQKLNNALKGIDWDTINASIKEWTINITDFLNSLIRETDWSLVGTSLGEGLNTIINSAFTFVTAFDWKKAGESLADIINGFLTKTDWGKLAWTLSEAIIGLADTAIALIRETDWKKVGSVIGELIINIDWWGLLKSLGELIWVSLVAVWEMLVGLMEGLGVTEFWVDVLLSVWDGIKNIWSSICNWFSGLWGVIVDWFQSVWDGIVNIFNFVGDWFKGVFQGAVDGIKNAWNGVTGFFSGIWTGIKNTFSKVTDWFKNTFSKAWQAVKDVFSKGGEIFNGIKDGILNTLKTVINGLISGINTVISIPFKGINTALEKMKSIEIAGWKPFEWISTIRTPQIPKLATGTVVPANYGEFAAILGDNKREPEIVSPLSTMKQAMREVLEEMNVMGGNGNIEYRFVAELNGKPIFEEVVTQDKIDRKRHGGRSRLGTVR